MQLLGQQGLGRIYVQHAGAARGTRYGDNEDGFGGFGMGRPRRPKNRTMNDYPKVPSEAGRNLMASGTFGNRGGYDSASTNRKVRLSRKLLRRELGLENGSRQKTANRSIAQVC